MIGLLGAIWVWVVLALLLGVLAGWLLWARPLRRAAAERARGR